jgi:hypothetical protein
MRQLLCLSVNSMTKVVIEGVVTSRTDKTVLIPIPISSIVFENIDLNFELFYIQTLKKQMLIKIQPHAKVKRRDSV